MAGGSFNLQEQYAGADAAAPAAGQGSAADQSITLTAEDISQLSALKAQGDIAGIGQYIAQLIP